MNQPNPQVIDGGLLPVIKEKRILISVGAGGVGKTTTAAALGLLGAHLGRRTLVMTIDPARRLADSLGLHGGLDHREREVPAELMSVAGLGPGLLYAMMLDQKKTFDEVVRRQAPDEASVRRVMANKLYRELSTRLAGGQEYAAMEKLYELSQRGDYELLILDTPPTANALDFLDAPKKMVELIDSPAVNLFLKSSRAAGRFSIGLLSAGVAAIFRRLARFVGGEFIEDLAQYFADMSTLLAGFRERAARVAELLGRPDVGFVVVTAPDPSAVEQAIALHDRLVDTGMAPLVFVVNRLHALASTDLTESGVAELLGEQGEERAIAAALAPVLLTAHRQIEGLAQADAVQLKRLTSRCGDDHAYARVPLFDRDIHDIGGLVELGRYLTAP